jgi:ferric-dicitrate binding protein FerR (iron transport regulator)
MSRLFRDAGRELEPSPEAVDRVQRAVTPSRAGLRDAAAEPDAAAVRRVHAGVLGRRRARRSPLGIGLLLGAGVAAAAALIVAVPSRPLHADLSADVPTTAPLTPEVTLHYQGDGTVTGSPKDVAIDWVVGTLDAEVEPERGIHLAVVTDEAHVRVTGTVFRVTRSALGTAVSVTRGGVEVVCGADAPRLLTPGDEAVCVPLTASGRLGRARALRTGGASTADVLAAVDAGLALTSPTDPVRGELLAFELDLLVSTGDTASARAVAAAYLDAGFPTRRGDVAALVETLPEESPDRADASPRPSP